MPARLARRKGHRVLIDAAKILCAGGRRDLVFILAGDEERDAYPKEIDRWAADAGLSGMVRRVGHCADIPAALTSAACVVAPSTEPEAFGRIAVEAQAMGAPVVVSDLGASAETVLAPPESDPSERTGWRAPPADASALAAAIGEALDLRAAARDALALRARNRVADLFSIERMCASTISVYETLLQPRPAG
jgi:glycosyltransferase involved in cell wall biosynthesis